jgi:hypothetical protein
MILRDKIIPVALVAALLGGSVGAIVSRKSTEPTTANYSTTPSNGLFDRQNTQQISDTDNSQIADNGESLASKVEDAASYRVGFLDGFNAGRDRNLTASNVAIAALAARDRFTTIITINRASAPSGRSTVTS